MQKQTTKIQHKQTQRNQQQQTLPTIRKHRQSQQRIKNNFLLTEHDKPLILFTHQSRRRDHEDM